MWLDKGQQFIIKIVTTPSKILNYIGSVVLFMLVIMTTIDVTGRYLFSKPLPATYELTQFMFSITVFFGMAYFGIIKRHIRINLLVDKFPPAAQNIIDTTTGLLSLGMCIVLSWQAFVQARVLQLDKLRSDIWHIPIFPFQFLIALALAIFAMVLLADFLESLATVLKRGGLLWLWLLPGAALVLLLVGMPVWLKSLPFTIDGLTFGGICVAIMFILLFLRMHIGFVLFVIAFLGMNYMTSITAANKLISMTPYNIGTTYIYSVMPLFIFMGLFASSSGIARSLYETSYKWLGHRRGGLAMATVGACAGFAAICGDSMATAVTMGSVALPEMKKYNYHNGLATGCVAAGGSVGILIPPSTAFIIYGLITDQSIGKLFMAGILPGILLTSVFIITISILCRRNPAYGPSGPVVPLTEKIKSLKDTWAAGALFLFVMGGIYRGVFTPTEAGALGSFGVLVIVLATKKFRWTNLYKALSESLGITGMIFIMFIGAIAFTRFFSITRLPTMLAEFIAGLDLPRLVIMICILVFYIILGCVMNVLPVIILTLPVIFPTVMVLGYDPIWFGVIMVLIVQIGVITPPIGMNVFAISGVAKGVPLSTIFRGIMPFWIAMIVAIAILIAFPQIALFLPNLLM